jgi:AICAR transformylase/IMP cyclohydrolase PurH
MKISKEKYDKSRPPSPEPLVKKEDKKEVNVINNIDIDGLTKAIRAIGQKEQEVNVVNNIDIEALTDAIRAMGKTNSLENVIFALKDAQLKSDAKHAELVSYLSDKLDVLVKTLKDKPTSFEFDVKRNNNGFISTVLVKPSRENPEEE